jgi:hypothetical protein
VARTAQPKKADPTDAGFTAARHGAPIASSGTTFCGSHQAHRRFIVLILAAWIGGPMSVAEREREREQRSRESFVDVRNVASYQPPGILATLKGRPVRIVATGDMPGHSPVCQYVDEDGRLNWNEQEQFTVIDSQYLPPSADTLREVVRSFTR